VSTRGILSPRSSRLKRVAAIDVQLLGRRLYETMLVWGTEEFSEPVMAEFAEIWRPARAG